MEKTDELVLEWLDNVKSILEMDMEGNDYCDSEFCDYDGIDSDDLDEKKAFRGQNRERDISSNFWT